VLYAELNKKVFSDRLKVAVHLVASSPQGNLLKIWGAATANALLLNFRLVLGTS